MTPPAAPAAADPRVRILPQPGLVRKETKTGHSYWYEGKRLVGVTTVLDLLAKPALIGWAAKQATLHVRTGWEPGKMYQQDEIDFVLGEARTKYNAVRDEAKDAGTIAHEWVQGYWYGVDQERPTNERAAQAVDEFLKWRLAHDVQILEVEFCVCDPVLGIAGTLDKLAIVDNEPFVRQIDLKTGKFIYLENVVQTAKYNRMLEPLVEGLPLGPPLLLHAPSAGGAYQVVKFEDLKVPEGRGSNRTLRPLTIDECVEVFDGLVPAYRNLAAVRKALRAIGGEKVTDVEGPEEEA